MRILFLLPRIFRSSFRILLILSVAFFLCTSVSPVAVQGFFDDEEGSGEDEYSVYEDDEDCEYPSVWKFPKKIAPARESRRKSMSSH